MISVTARRSAKSNQGIGHYARNDKESSVGNEVETHNSDCTGHRGNFGKIIRSNKRTLSSLREKSRDMTDQINSLYFDFESLEMFKYLSFLQSVSFRHLSRSFRSYN